MVEQRVQWRHADIRTKDAVSYRPPPHEGAWLVFLRHKRMQMPIEAMA